MSNALREDSFLPFWAQHFNPWANQRNKDLFPPKKFVQRSRLKVDLSGFAVIRIWFVFVVVIIAAVVVCTKVCSRDRETPNRADESSKGAIMIQKKTSHSRSIKTSATEDGSKCVGFFGPFKASFSVTLQQFVHGVNFRLHRDSNSDRRTGRARLQITLTTRPAPPRPLFR